MSSLELWWLGQSGFRLRDPAGGPTVFVDPYLARRDDRTWQAPLTPEGLAQEADLVLASHEHTDHLDKPTLKQAAHTPGARFTLVVPSPLAEQVCSELDLPRARVIAAQPDQPIDVEGVTVHPLPARHGVNVSDAYTFGQELSGGQVRYLGYVVDLGGARAYHAGDCIPYPDQVARLQALQPHLALLPINGRDFYRESERNLVGNMDPREAARLASEIGAQVLVPMHWELFPHNRGFPADLVAYAETHFPELSVLLMGRGSRLTLTM